MYQKPYIYWVSTDLFFSIFRYSTCLCVVCCGFGCIMVHPSDVIQQHHLCNDNNINTQVSQVIALLHGSMKWEMKRTGIVCVKLRSH